MLKETTPPSASLPQREEIGPRAISALARLSKSTKSRLADKKGPKENSSATLTPSTSVRTRFPPIPRMLNPLRPKRLPVPETVTPGSKRTRSAISRANSSSIRSESITSIVAAISLSGRSVLDPTTVIVSRSVATTLIGITMATVAHTTYRPSFFMIFPIAYVELPLC